MTKFIAIRLHRQRRLRPSYRSAQAMPIAPLDQPRGWRGHPGLWRLAVGAATGDPLAAAVRSINCPPGWPYRTVGAGCGRPNW